MIKKIIYILIALYLVQFIACERYIESSDPIRTLADDVPVPSNLSLFVDNLSVTITWEISDPSSIDKYRVYASENDTSHYQVVDSSSSTEIILSNLTANRLYYYKVAAVHTSGLEGDRSSELFSQVGIHSMVIDNNNELTNRAAIQVQFTLTNSASNVMISEDSTFAGAIFEPFSAQRNFTLSDGDGIKTVYAKLLFSNGASNSQLLLDSIELDTEARIDSVFFLSPSTLYSPGDTIVFGLITGELNGSARASFTGGGNISLSDDGTQFDPTADDGAYYGWYVVPNNTNVHNATVTGNFSDEAGNNAQAKNSFDLLNINTRPEPIELLVTITPDDSAHFSWTASDEPDFESYRIFSGATSVIVVADDNLINYEPNVNTRTTTIMPAVGTTFYRIYVFDAHGEYRPSENFIEITRP